MKNINSLIIVSIFLASCQTNQKKITDIPKTEFLSNNKDFEWQQDILLFKGKPYDGFTIEKFPNQKLSAKKSYLNGKLEGKQEKWFENGAKMEDRYYTNNHKMGMHEGWYSNGQKRFEYFIENDIPIKTHRAWHPNGHLFTRFNFNKKGQPEGVQQMWFPTGQIKANYVIKNGRRFGFLGAKACMGENEKKQTFLNFKK